MDSLFLREDIDIYITVSNGCMLSGELATLLTGRYVELSMLPLSFSEYCSGAMEEGISRQELFDQYMSSGSFPYILRYDLDVQEAREYLSGIYNTVLLNDVVKRLKVSDANMLESITRFMMYNIGNRTSPSTIANTMTSAHMKIDPKTVDRYIRGLTDSLLFYEVRRYNIKGKRLLSTMNKYFLCDVAFRELLVGGRGQDAGSCT